jgi:hypothetical protein
VAALRTYSARSCPQPDAYGVDLARSRLEAVVPDLPATAAIGYLSDLSPAEHTGGMALHAVQYALAPRLVADLAKFPGAEWVIGYFHRPADFAALGAARGLEIVRDHGNGVVVFRRKAAQ